MAKPSPDEIAARRLAAQGLTRPGAGSVAEVVGRMGAIQAQDSLAAKWAIGLRLSSAAALETEVDAALAEGAILRTHLFRGTWQLVTPADVRWMLGLVGARVIARSARRFRELGLDEATFRKSRAVLEKSLRGGGQLTREELGAALSRASIDPAGQRLPHLLGRAELEGLLCSGPRRGRQPTWTLLDEWAPAEGRPLNRPAALAELAGRYFRSRGPATIEDFVWWSGLPPSEARAGLESVEGDLIADRFAGRTTWRAGGRARKAPSPAVHLLPAFDEYLVAYRRRDAVVSPEHARRLNAGGGMLAPAILVDGKVAGTWRRTFGRKRAISIETDLFAPPTRAEGEALARAERRYAAFLGRPRAEPPVRETSRRQHPRRMG